MSATIHSVVMDERTIELRHLVQERLDEAWASFMEANLDEFTHLIRSAYIRGVRDGFQQGALAAAASAPGGETG